jgi:hypothetical protein
MEDKHVTPIPSDVLAQANIDAANALLAPYLLPLTPDERHDLPKMGDKTLSFVEKAQDYAHKYPRPVLLLRNARYARSISGRYINENTAFNFSFNNCSFFSSHSQSRITVHPLF